MAKKLVIVESPTKAKILKKILGRDFAVESSTGHIRDLPSKKDHLTPSQRKLPYASLGIDVDNEFKPLYCSTPAKKKTIKKLKDQIGAGTELYLATDEDREGEAIAWHLKEVLDPKDTCKTYRAVFHEITKKAVEEAFHHPRDINANMVEAQQARRILDRLVGYKLSPLLWSKIRYGLSAGRVQSAVVRMIVDREREIQAFTPEEYWSILGLFEKAGSPFEAGFVKKNGERFIPSSETEAQAVLDAVGKGPFKVESIEKKEFRRNPAPPFITSSLQQEASRKLGYSVKRTMQLAQRLYEGVDLKDAGGATGLITYMRTDSTNLADSAVKEIRDTLKDMYGDKYVPEKPRFFKKKSRGAQEAHEAIRPTDVRRKPESLRGILDNDQLKLYDLIWKRALACQAAMAVYESVGADLVKNEHTFRATGQTLVFPGYTKIYTEGSDQPDSKPDSDKILPALEEGEMLTANDVQKKQHFTKPPPRYTEASIIRKMEEEGIGRPSTYAPTISTVISRGYVKMESKQLSPTDTAFVVNDFLVNHFPDVVDLNFTAGMETTLDDIAEGKQKMLPFLNEFFFPFQDRVNLKNKEVKKEDVVSEPSDEVCEECGKPMVIKLGRAGKFLSCSDYPKCKNAKALGGISEERKALIEKYKDEKCPTCGADMTVKESKFGEFLACTAYPKCKTTKPIEISSGVTCPKCDKGELIQKRGKRGQPFWGCSTYPECDYVSNRKPIRNSDKDEPGFYVDRDGEEVFMRFDAELYAKRQQRYSKKKKTKESN